MPCGTRAAIVRAGRRSSCRYRTLSTCALSVRNWAYRNRNSQVSTASRYRRFVAGSRDADVQQVQAGTSCLSSRSNPELSKPRWLQPRNLPRVSMEADWIAAGKHDDGRWTVVGPAAVAVIERVVTCGRCRRCSPSASAFPLRGRSRGTARESCGCRAGQ
jgi:hypothetical protein